MKVGDSEQKKVEQFKYLGSTINNNLKMKTEIQKREDTSGVDPL